MQSLFVKCQKCQQRPATIKCSQCRYGQTYRLCYSCDSQIHNRTGPIDQQHKTEIIPYQEMYQKNQNFAPAPSKLEQSNQIKKNEFKAQPPTKDYLSSETRKPDYSKTIDVNRKPEYPDKKHDYLDKKVDSHDKRYDQQYSGFDKKQYTSNQKPQEQDRASQSIMNQLKDEQQQTERLKAELNMAKDREKDFQKRLSKLEQDYESKHREDKQKLQQLQDENKNLNQKLNQANRHLQEEINKVRQQYESQLNELEQAYNEKEQQLEQIAQEFNLEEIQKKIEELQQESDMKDQIIEQYQQQLQDIGNKQNNSRNTRNQFSSNKKLSKSQDNDKDQLIQNLQQQLEAKDEDCRKLEDLIENFKPLYQNLSDEKQQLQEEVEKLANENNQFREIFSQNLHLFGIDPEQLNEEGEEGEGEYPEEIAEENDDQND
ncbi:unnamed protein product (macronuclear) [Paramecium tetraurelia]|uniref:ZZ-type domain-containing protein n=1 Tax=Paramecium tetraurelia TaxID=5888 RepID=A0D4L4_PARTE|nr:uncharacterized protein GSPATT00039258001 [Paramecium tetraurelia]CAK77981.1 unnamed protein product [Paramecium tetraurelia]|eukprot:XP_001445378.1 hypothetical protein (macronuclear) [Paramecium tetraurelia strain d4-2]